MNKAQKIGIGTTILLIIVGLAVVVMQKSEDKQEPQVAKKAPVHKIIMKCGEGKCGMGMMEIVPVKKK